MISKKHIFKLRLGASILHFARRMVGRSLCRYVFNGKLKWLYLSHFLMQRLEILYEEPLGATPTVEYLRFHPGYLQIPYLTIHAAICRYHHNSAISWHRELKFCMVSPQEPTFLLSILDFTQVICRYLICRYMLLFVDTIITRPFFGVKS